MMPAFQFYYVPTWVNEKKAEQYKAKQQEIERQNQQQKDKDNDRGMGGMSL